MDKIYIYTLSDPITNEIRYVGKTIRKPEIRLKGHISRTKSSKDKYYSQSWIKSILDRNLKPRLDVIEETNDVSRETYWIDYYRNSGCNLTNLTNGGEENTRFRRKMSEQSKTNIGEGHKTRFYYVHDRYTGEFLFKMNRADFTRKYKRPSSRMNNKVTKEFILAYTKDEDIKSFMKPFYVIYENDKIINVFKEPVEIEKHYTINSKRFYKWVNNISLLKINGIKLKIVKEYKNEQMS